MGCAGIALAVYVHVSFFWGPKVGQTFLTDLLKIASLIIAIGGAASLIVRVLVFGAV